MCRALFTALRSWFDLLTFSYLFTNYIALYLFVCYKFTPCKQQLSMHPIHRYETAYLSRNIEYCDIDDIKVEYASEIKAILQRAREAAGEGEPNLLSYDCCSM